MNRVNLGTIQKQTVIVRTCYDIPNLSELFRLHDSLPTIRQLLNQNNKVVIISYKGRPGGTVNLDLSLESLKPVLEKELPYSVSFLNQYDLGFDQVKEIIESSREQVFLLENTRFHPTEQSNHESDRLLLASKYAKLGNCFVDDCFPASHRSEVTNTELKELLPSCFGLSYEHEITNLNKLKVAEPPFVVIMGGAKLETKLNLVEKMLDQADIVILGGLLCFTFLAAANRPAGLSPVEEKFLPTATELLKRYPDKILLPSDFVWSKQEKEIAVDVGKQSIEEFKEVINQAKTIFWNGPLGNYEKGYTQGTLSLAEAIISNDRAFKVAGGGDTLTTLPSEIKKQFDFVSSAGGATLSYLSN